MPRAATHAARAATAGPKGSRATASRYRPAHAGASSRSSRTRGGAGAATAPPATRRPHRPTVSRAETAPSVLRLPARSASGVLDGLLRGRLWVALVGLLLAGIVFLNVSLLGLDGGIAATSDQVSELKQENSELRLRAARLGSSERIEREAQDLGFVMPAPADVTYLEAEGGDDGGDAVAALEGRGEDKADAALTGQAPGTAPTAVTPPPTAPSAAAPPAAAAPTVAPPSVAPPPG